jgi:hypothetical protein
MWPKGSAGRRNGTARPGRRWPRLGCTAGALAPSVDLVGGAGREVRWP